MFFKNNENWSLKHDEQSQHEFQQLFQETQPHEFQGKEKKKNFYNYLF